MTLFFKKMLGQYTYFFFRQWNNWLINDCFLYRIMAPIPIDMDCVWNYSFCELMYLGVEIDEDWYSVGNIEYNVLNEITR
jgi:hypothetical protein